MITAMLLSAEVQSVSYARPDSTDSLVDSCGTDTGFPGTYQVASPGYEGAKSIDIEHRLVSRFGYLETELSDTTYQPGEFYDLNAYFGDPDSIFKARGIEAFGYLGTVGGIGEPLVAVHQKQETGLSGLFAGTKDTVVYPETTSLAGQLQLSVIDYAGTYRVTFYMGLDTCTTEYWEDEMARDMPLPVLSEFDRMIKIESSNPVWRVSIENSAGDEFQGMGIATGDVLAIGFVIGNVTEVWMLKRNEINNNLEGKWLFIREDSTGNMDSIIYGLVHAERE